MTTLEIVSGKAAGTVVDLAQFEGKDKITLGNRRTASVVIKDPWVSFMHAVITQDGSEFLIADKRSKAGTFVNGNKIGQTGTRLRSGDTIALGKTQMKFTLSGKAAAPAAAGGPFTPASKPVDSSGPFTPHAAPAASAPGSDTARLESDLRKAQGDLTSLRAALAQRDKVLAETMERTRVLEAGGGDPEVAEKLKSAQARSQQLARTVQATTDKATIRIEELTRLNKTLEGRLAQGGAGNVVQSEKEISRLREEGRKLQAETRLRIQTLTQELEAVKTGGVSSEALAKAQAKAEEAAAKISTLEEELEKAKASFGHAQSQKMELEMHVEDLQGAIEKLSKGGEETAAMETLITNLNTELSTVKDELIAVRAQALAAPAVTAAAPPAPAAPANTEKLAELEASVASLESKLAEAEARAQKAEAEAKQTAAAAPPAPAAAAAPPAPAPAAAPAVGGDTDRVKELEAENEGLLKDLEEINEDMLAQEEEYMERIQELEDKLAGN